MRQGGRGGEISLTFVSFLPSILLAVFPIDRIQLKVKEQRHLGDVVHRNQPLGHRARWTGQRMHQEGQTENTQPPTSYRLTNSLGGGSGFLFYAEQSSMESRLLQQDSNCCETNLLK